MNASWQFSTAGNFVYGRGVSSEIGEIVSRRRWKRLMVVTDRNLIGLPNIAKIIQLLQEVDREVSIFDQGVAEPGVQVPISAAEQGVAFRADCVVAIGGGSNIDVAKMAATLIRHGGKPSDYFGFDRIPGAILPLVAIPTTAGTGSEVSHSSVLTDPESSNKVSSLSPYLRPAIALVDPALTDSCPKKVTADSGIDALVHAIEAFTAKPYYRMGEQTQETRAYSGANPMGDLLAAEAIRLIGSNLERVVTHPADQSARDAMSWAASLAGMAFSNSGVALVHALEYPIGAAVHCSHGEGNGLLLPHVMRFNQSFAMQRYAEVARLLGCISSDGEPAESIVERGIERIEQLSRKIGLAESLKSLGVVREDLPKFAEASSKISRLVHINPRPSNSDELLGILQAAYDA